MTDTTNPSCGPFRLVERIGEGGMATVWRGSHHRNSVPVAVKFVKRLASADTETLEQFRHEARAHAGLDHPNVVRLLDFGRTREPIHGGDDSDIAEGTPFLVTEFAPEGAASDRQEPNCWPTLRNWLLQVLDGLAFTHARGVVHRDLKPENMLLFDGEADGFRLKLADFGLATAGRDLAEDLESGPDPSAGTPHYMTPEQLRGVWRQFGPWTDLYQVGAVAWDWATGRPPYLGDGVMEIAVGHIDEPLPAFEPRFPVPDAFESWLRSLLRKAPSDRLERAADAAHRLDALEFRSSSVVAESAEASTVEVDAETTVPNADTMPLHGQETAPMTTLAPTLESVDGPEAEETGDRETSTPDRTSPPEGERADDVRPQLPKSWRRASTYEPPLPLVDAGLGLFDLREVPFVDRNDERDAVWESLRRAIDRRHPECLLVEGGSGTGKSRLVQWMLHRAHETGACRFLRASHDRNQESSAALAGMLEDLFRTWELGRAEAFELIEQRLAGWRSETETPPRPEALTEWIRPSSGLDAPGPPHQFDSKQEQYAVLTRLAAFLADRRPLVVWLDDIQWGREALGWLDQLTRRGRLEDRAPLLFVATARSDEGDQRARENLERTRDIVSREKGTRLQLASLDKDDHALFVDRLIALEPELAGRVRERTEGNPLFAVQLVGDWVQRDWLERGEGGFRLADSADPRLPDAIHGLWRRRLDRLFGGVEDRKAAWLALELAAALGRIVREDEWRALCDKVGVEIPASLLDRLLSAGLLEDHPSGFAFVHQMLVESIGQHAREAGRWSDHHRTCAAMLAGGDRGHPEERALRRADHFEEAGDLDRAIDIIGDALPRLRGRVAYERHREALDRRAALMDHLGLTDDDIRRLRTRIERATLQLNRDIDRAARLADRLEQKVRDRGTSGDLARLLLVDSASRFRKREIEAVSPIHDEIDYLLRDVDDDRLRGRLHYQRSFVALAEGRPEDSEEHVRQATDLFDRVDDDGWRWRAKFRMCHVLRSDRRWDAICEYADEFVDKGREMGSSFVEAAGMYFRGIGLSRRHEWEAASAAFERAENLYRRIGSEQDLTKALLGRLDVALGRSRMETATHLLETVADRVDKQGLRGCEPTVRLARAHLAVERRNWDTFAAALEQVWTDSNDNDRRSERERDLVERLRDRLRAAGEEERATRIDDLSPSHSSG